ncbi:MAG: hypothetical protein ACOH17_04285 [Cellulomonas sp.]
MSTGRDITALDEARTIELIDELVGRWRDRNRGTLTLAVRDHQAVALVVFGLTTQAVNVCAAIVALHRQGEEAAIVALTRQVLELCTTAVWVELCGRTAAEALMAEQTRQQVNEIKAFVKLGMQGGEAALESLSEDTQQFLKHESGRYVEQRCSELIGGDVLYATYRAASELSHASTAIVDMYLHPAPPNSTAPASLRFTPDVETQPWIMTSLSLLLQACLSFDRLDVSHTGRARLREVARELGVEPRMALSVEGSRSQRVRVRAERTRRRNRAQGARA